MTSGGSRTIDTWSKEKLKKHSAMMMERIMTHEYYDYNEVKVKIKAKKQKEDFVRY